MFKEIQRLSQRYKESEGEPNEFRKGNLSSYSVGSTDFWPTGLYEPINESTMGYRNRRVTYTMNHNLLVRYINKCIYIQHE